MIEGRWHEKGSAASFPAKFSSPSVGYFELVIQEGSEYSGYLSTLQVSDRLGNVERKITFEDGSMFATKENDAIDKLFKQQTQANNILHTLETHIGWVLIALVVTILSSAAFFKWGIPWASTTIAHALPHKTNDIIAGHTFEFLDTYMFEETKLPLKKREEIRQHFKTKLLPLTESDDPIAYKIHFRLWGDANLSIPNALALPSGDIILTDKFVQLCQTQDEIDAVLLHEMGHVIHRHSLEMLIESTFVTVAVMMITGGGDSGGLADMGIGLGSLMLSSSYSRGHEGQADLYAFKQMLTAGIDPIAFSNIMDRMDKYIQENDRFNKDKKEDKPEDNILDYISSHPSTQERVDIAKAYSECFKKGLQPCEVRDVKK